jgi:putative membrane protein
MKRLLRAGLAGSGLALQLCAVTAFAQSQPIPSAPVTTPPAAGAQPPSGGPTTPPMTEPANAIQKSGSVSNNSAVTRSSAVNQGGVSPGANSFTEAQARSRLQRNGYAQVSQLTKDQDGIWRGSATRNGSQVHVAVDFKGHISTN